MSSLYEPDLFVSAAVKRNLSHLEEIVGCRKGTLNSVSSPVDYRDSLQCYSRLRRMFNEVDRKYYASRLSAGLAFAGAAAGAIVNFNMVGHHFDAAQVSALNTFMFITVAVGGMIGIGLHREEKFHRERLMQEISEFRDRLPARTLE